jgi:hypothetical protein
LSKKDKIILLLKQGETSSTIIANKVSCDPNYVGVVRAFRMSEWLVRVEVQKLVLPTLI